MKRPFPRRIQPSQAVAHPAPSNAVPDAARVPMWARLLFAILLTVPVGLAGLALWVLIASRGRDPAAWALALAFGALALGYVRAFLPAVIRGRAEFWTAQPNTRWAALLAIAVLMPFLFESGDWLRGRGLPDAAADAAEWLAVSGAIALAVWLLRPWRPRPPEAVRDPERQDSAAT